MSTPIDDGGGAYPCTPPDGNPNAYAMFPSSPGMTLRDYFAGQALAGWLASFGEGARHPVDVDHGDFVADCSYKMADAMIAARKGGRA